MGSLLELQADKPKSEMLYDLKGMTTARQALIKDRTAARARLATATHPLLRKQATLRLRQVERDIAQIDATIETIITTDKALSEKADILINIPPLGHACMPCRAAGHCESYRICDADRNARAGQLERKASRESGRSCPNLAPIWKMAGQRAHPGRASLPAKGDLSTCRSRRTLQSGYESQIS